MGLRLAEYAKMGPDEAKGATMTGGCDHKWGPFTPREAECARCGRKRPRVDLLAERQAMVEALLRQLQQALTKRDRLTAKLRAWADAVAEGHAMAPAAGDTDVENTLRTAADAIENGEAHPSAFR